MSGDRNIYKKNPYAGKKTNKTVSKQVEEKACEI